MTTQSLTHWTAVQFVSALDSSVSGALSNADALSELYAHDTCANCYPCSAEQVDAMVASDDGSAPCLSRDDIDWTGYDAANAIAAQLESYTIVTDSGKVTITAVDADAAAREYARREDMRGVEDADDLRAYVERKGGYGHMEASDGEWLWSVAQ